MCLNMLLRPWKIVLNQRVHREFIKFWLHLHTGKRVHPIIQFKEFQQIKNSSQDIKYFHHSKMFLLLLAKNSTHLSDNCFDFHLHILELYINLIKQYLLFCVWLLSVVTILTFINVIGYIDGFFFFNGWEVFVVWIYHHLFIRSPVDGPFGLFPVWGYYK